jgi:phosphopantothenoylcysteine decarboxylase/phosphopantothenate--cysteine ligase
MLKGKHVLLGVTASIAAYKTAALTRLLIKEGAEVKVIMTPSSKDFVTPLTLSTLSKNPVFTEYFDGNTGAWNSHIELAEWADIYLIAPLSANTLAKMAWGVCDNLLLATYLSARCQVFFAPAMDLEMYRQKTVQDNIESLLSQGHILIPPGSGELASGLEGEGRMEEPEQITSVLSQWEGSSADFKGKRLLISAGPTQEHLDPVRFISNHSSGKMGLAIAVEAAKRGAEVTFVHGPLSVKIPTFLKCHAVVSAEEMYQACLKYAPKADVIIMSAAVADYSPVLASDQKIKKQSDLLTIEFKKTRDILKSLGEKKTKKQVLVGFALETQNEKKNAEKKLVEKKLDLIVLNSLQDKGATFNSDSNKITLIGKDKKSKDFPLKNKREVARDLLNYISTELL